MSQDGGLACTFADIHLNVEHVEVIGLEDLVAPLYLGDDGGMRFEEHTECLAVGRLRDALTVAAIVVEALTGCLDGPGLLEQKGKGKGVLEHLAHRKADMVEERLAEDLVAGVSMLVSLSVEPVCLHVVIDGFGLKAHDVLTGGSVMNVDGVFEDVDVGIFGYTFHERPVGAFANKIVGIDKRDIVARGDGDACVAGIAESAILLVDNPDARVFGGPLITENGTAVGRSVIDEDNLQMGVILAQHTLHTTVEGVLGTIDGNDNSQFHGYKDSVNRVKYQIILVI